MTVAERIAHYRAAAGLTQRGLAQLVGLDPSAVGHWERGFSAPRDLEAVVAALGLTMAEFYSDPQPKRRRRVA